MKTTRTAAALLVAALVAPAPGRAEKLDKKAQDWLKDVRLLILPEEEATFRGLATAGERAEFQRIFWARRSGDPRGASPEGPEGVRKARARADALFSSSGQKGTRTGCGQVYLLMGEPDEVAAPDIGNQSGRDLRLQFDSLEALKEGTRRPEAWVYKSRPDRTFPLPRGELRIEFDDTCIFVEAARIMEELRSSARARVLHPELDYSRDGNGRLVRLEQALLAGAGAAAFLAEDKSAFPLAVESKLLLRSQSGQGFAAGLLRGTLAGAPGPLRVRVVAQAKAADGRVAGSFDREVAATREADGTFLAAYGLTLDPGRYEVRAGLALPPGGEAATTSQVLEVPRFDGAGLVVSPLFVAPEGDGGAPGATDPFAPFVIGQRRIVPRFGNRFTRADALQVVAVIYGGEADAAGKASIKARFRVLKDGRPVARDSEQAFETSTAAASIGPVPLEGFAPGKYVVRLEVSDERAQRKEQREAEFELHE